MGRKIVLTGTTLTDPTAPRLAIVDPIESAGSLYLMDITHPTDPMPAGVPANGASIPNLFSGTLVALHGSGADDPSFVVGGNINNGTLGSIERSGKGGIHVIVSQANALTATDGARIDFGPTLAAYVSANTGHDYYLSIWDRQTRANVDATNYTLDYSTANPRTLGIAQASGSAGWQHGSRATLGYRNLGNALAPRFASIAVDGADATDNADSGLPVWGAPATTYNSAVLASRNGKWPSFVFYRCYIEDLTVSGRTYAEVDAIDYALYQKEVLNPGGRYYGDTFTDPVTIP